MRKTIRPLIENYSSAESGRVKVRKPSMFLLKASMRGILYIEDRLFCGQIVVAPGESLGAVHACLKVFKL